MPNNAPSAHITSPDTDSAYPPGVGVNFEGTGTDPEDGSLPASAFLWTSSLDGIINIGNTFFYDHNLSVGKHTITLTVTDSAGAKGSTTTNVAILNCNVAFCKQILHYYNGVLNVDDITVECVQGPTGATVSNHTAGKYVICGTYKLGSYSSAGILIKFGGGGSYDSSYEKAIIYSGEGRFTVAIEHVSGGSGDMYVRMSTGITGNNDGDIIIDDELVNQNCQ